MTILIGDCVEVMSQWAENSVDAIVCDPIAQQRVDAAKHSQEKP